MLRPLPNHGTQPLHKMMMMMKAMQGKYMAELCKLLLVHMSNLEPRNVLSYELFLLICTHMGS